METNSLIDTLGDNLSELKADRHWDVLGDVKTNVLADPVAFTFSSVRSQDT